MTRLDGKVIAITGAGGGIGATCARHCARLGASVVVNDIDEQAATATCKTVRDAGGEAATCAGDVADFAFGARLAAFCVDRFGRLDGLVNNAGILRHGRLADMSEADLRAMLDVNTIGAAGCAIAAIGAMRSAGAGGAVVNVTSGSQAGDIALGGYAASKAAVAALTFTWAMELRGTGIRVNAVSPLAETAMAASNRDLLAEQGAAREISYTALPDPEINAPVVAFLLSDAAADVHGQIVRIAGRELSYVTHPMVAEPVLEGTWTDARVAEAFRTSLGRQQQKLGLCYMRAEKERHGTD